jgi:hypothetical protein
MVSSLLRVPVRWRLSGVARPQPIHHLLRPIPVRWFAQTARAQKKGEHNGHDEGASSKRRTSPGKNSLRRVSIEAERSRLVINKAGRKFIDPDANTKACVWLIYTNANHHRQSLRTAPPSNTTFEPRRDSSRRTASRWIP